MRIEVQAISKGSFFVLGLVFLFAFVSEAEAPRKKPTLTPRKVQPEISEKNSPQRKRTEPMRPVSGFKGRRNPFVTSLTCPSNPQRRSLRPALPPFEEGNDCSLEEQRAAVEAYIDTMEGVLEGCRERHQANWAQASSARDRLDREIDAIPLREDGGGDSAISSMRTVPSSQGMYFGQACDDGFGSLGSSPFVWRLQRFDRCGFEYCSMIGKLVEPLEDTCEELNQSLAGQVGIDEEARQKFHESVEVSMGEVQKTHQLAESLYGGKLQPSVLNSFRDSFAGTDLCESGPDPGGLIDNVLGHGKKPEMLIQSPRSPGDP